MSQNAPLTVPVSQAPRTTSINVRLTEAERSAIDSLATQFGVTTSHMARHFLMQAVNYFNQNSTRDKTGSAK